MILGWGCNGAGLVGCEQEISPVPLECLMRPLTERPLWKSPYQDGVLLADWRVDWIDGEQDIQLCDKCHYEALLMKLQEGGNHGS